MQKLKNRNLFIIFVLLKDRSGDRCKPHEELCPEGICVPKCDGNRDCASGADELNCPSRNTSIIVSPEVTITGPNVNFEG